MQEHTYILDFSTCFLINSFHVIYLKPFVCSMLVWSIVRPIFRHVQILNSVKYMSINALLTTYRQYTISEV